jgi:hypothetical protein
MNQFFDGGFEALDVRCVPRNSALPNTLHLGLLCDGAGRPAVAARP